MVYRQWPIPFAGTRKGSSGREKEPVTGTSLSRNRWRATIRRHGAPHSGQQPRSLVLAAIVLRGIELGKVAKCAAARGSGPRAHQLRMFRPPGFDHFSGIRMPLPSWPMLPCAPSRGLAFLGLHSRSDPSPWLIRTPFRLNPFPLGWVVALNGPRTASAS